ncbi:phage tail protein [Salmonella enterica subsp. enterica]|uniref:Phage tail protein n=1 Tax=Salmonella enterica I TaxID=59201 RepID=A0A447N5L6_SALET|nr:phage tail protein [Salmonella enterica subsp. enterica]
MKVRVDAGRHPRRDFAPGITGALRAWLKTVLQANPGLSELGVILPHGTAIDLPDVPSSPVTETINLWE